MTRVLIVHPRREVLDRLRDCAQKLKLEPTCVATGEQAIDRFIQEPFPIVILDIDLPGRDGIATISAIRWAPGGDSVRWLMTGTHANQKAFDGALAIAKVEGVKDAELTKVRKFLAPHLDAKKPKETKENRRVVIDREPEAKASALPDADAEGKDVKHRAEEVQRTARLEGRLEKTPFPFVVARLYEQSATGALLLQAEGDPRRTTEGDRPQKVVFFQRGRPIHVRSNLVDECLGQQLLWRGEINKEELEESLRRVRAGAGQQGAMLIAMGALTPKNLRASLEAQQQEKLFDIFGWSGGAFLFSEKMSAPPSAVTLEMSTVEIIIRGIRERVPPVRVLDALQRRGELFVSAPTEEFRGLRPFLSVAERAPIEQANGRTTLSEVLAAGGVASAAALWAALCLSMVSLRATAQKTSARPQKKPTRQRGGTQHRRLLAQLLPLLREGRYNAAFGLGEDPNPEVIRRAGRTLKLLLKEVETDTKLTEAVRALAKEANVRVDRGVAVLLGSALQGAASKHQPLGQSNLITKEIPGAASIDSDSDEVPLGKASETTSQLSETNPLPVAKAEPRFEDETQETLKKTAERRETAASKERSRAGEAPTNALPRPSQTEPESISADIPTGEFERAKRPTFSPPARRDQGGEQGPSLARPAVPSFEQESIAPPKEFYVPPPEQDVVAPLSKPPRKEPSAPFDPQLKRQGLDEGGVLQMDGADLDERVERMLHAERHFRRGCRAIDRGKYESAVTALLRAVEIAPDEGEFIVYLGWAEHEAGAGDAAAQGRALDRLKKAAEMAPKLDRAHLFLARAYRSASRFAEARNAYENALAANPQCREALVELQDLGT